MPGMFIAIEGPDRVGKSTLWSGLANVIDSQFVREPGGTLIGEQIRDIVLRGNACTETEILLFLADRAEHVNGVINPWITLGKHVVTDRYDLSTIVYNCILKNRYDLIDLAMSFSDPVPDLTVCLLPEEGFTRDYMNELDTRFTFKQVRDAYIEGIDLIQELSPRNIVPIVTKKPVKAQEEAMRVIINFYNHFKWK